VHVSPPGTTLSTIGDVLNDLLRERGLEPYPNAVVGVESLLLASGSER
jgi:hypothetical protein